MTPQDWHPEEVKAAIRMRGTTLTNLAIASGYEASAVRRALRNPWPAIERVIANFLETRPQDIWPSRYRADGSPMSSRRREPKGAARSRHRQIERAA